MSSLDLSTTLLWQSLSKDVYTYGKQEGSKGGPDTIMEVSSDTESRPLLPKTENPRSVAKRIKDRKLHRLSNSDDKHRSLPIVSMDGTGWLTTSFLIVNTALGIGILNFPAAYNQAGGIYFATGIQIVMVTLMMSTMFILAYCSDVNGDKTYHDVLLSMCGRKGQQLAAISIALTLYCVCVASLIIIGDQLDSLFHTAFGIHFCDRWYLDRSFTIPVTAICFILPACFCKRVDFLGYIGSVGIFAMLYPVFLTVYGYYKIPVQPSTIKTWPTDISAMFAIMPVLGLGYQCQEVVVPIYSCMKERRLCSFIRSSVLSMSFLFVIYSVIGCFGYLTFGSAVAHNIMKMYDASDPFVMIGVGALIIKMIVTYPLLALCGRDAVGGIYAELRGLKPAEFKATERTRRYICATIWFGTSLLLAVLTSGIGIVIKYLGSVASANIFIYPGICLIKVVLKNDPQLSSTKSRFLACYGITIAAFGGFCFGTVLLQAILNKSTEPPIDVCIRTKV